MKTSEQIREPAMYVGDLLRSKLKEWFEEMADKVVLLENAVETLKVLLSHPSDDCFDAVETADGLYLLTPLQIAERNARKALKRLG